MPGLFKLKENQSLARLYEPTQTILLLVWKQNSSNLYHFYIFRKEQNEAEAAYLSKTNTFKNVSVDSPLSVSTTRLAFEITIGQVSTSNITVYNRGSIAFQFEWLRVDRPNPLQVFHVISNTIINSAKMRMMELQDSFSLLLKE